MLVEEFSKVIYAWDCNTIAGLQETNQLLYKIFVKKSIDFSAWLSIRFLSTSENIAYPSCLWARAGFQHVASLSQDQQNKTNNFQFSLTFTPKDNLN